jgi:iron complex outermembrane receptor protein
MIRLPAAKTPAVAFAIANLIAVTAAPAQAQQSGNRQPLPEIEITAPNRAPRATSAKRQLRVKPAAVAARARPTRTAAPVAVAGYASTPNYNTGKASLGPLGRQSIQDTPASITVIPQDLIANQQLKTVNDTLRFLPSVQIRNQQGFEVSRPQARGFQSSIVQNTRLDGLNVIGTTAIAAENLSGIEVLNGLSGALYGPASPSGVFNYTLKRPTDEALVRYIQGFDSRGVFTEATDIGGRSPDGKVGYRLNAVHGEGESWAPGSTSARTLASASFDFHLDEHTVLETDFSHYSAAATGLPGSIVYASGKSTVLPVAVDPTRPGYAQIGAGTNLITETGLVKLKHDINNDWNFEIGGLYQDAERNLFGIANTMTDNLGNFSVTKNFTAVPHFTIASNTASLNGRFDTFGMLNELTIATNGFVNGQYNYRNSIATVLGNSSLANPAVLPQPPVPYNGGQYKSAELSQQSIITGDTLHFNDQLALQGVLSTSFLSSKSYAVTGATTSSDQENGLLSPTVSLIYKPIPKLTTYATYANSVEQGEQAPAGTANVNQVLAPYRDTQYEVGAKYAVSSSLLLTVAGFQMTRPLAVTDATTNVFGVVGTQKNTGIELFAQGDITPELSVFGGATWIDARLEGSNNSTTNGKLVVGVPSLKSDIAIDYHPAFGHGLALTGAVHYESVRAATNTNNSFAPSYGTLDLGMRYSTTYQKRAATFRFQVLNVTNTVYYSSIADGNIVGSPGANTAYLGTPRVYMASVEVDFWP